MTRRGALAAALTLGCVVLVGCHGSSGADPTASVTPSAIHTPDPNYDQTPDIWITSSGLRPKDDIVILGQTVRWLNKTTQPARIRFDNGTVDSGTIHPGSSFSYHPTTTVSIAYRLTLGAADHRGVVEVSPAQDPGESPAS